VYVEAIRFSGKTYHSTGTLQLNLNSDDKKLGLEISLDKNQYQPADKAKISLLLKNSEGQPVAGEINLNLVDEAYYSLFSENLNTLSEIYKSVSSDIMPPIYLINILLINLEQKVVVVSYQIQTS
jgi:hypothetical protein